MYMYMTACLMVCSFEALPPFPLPSLSLSPQFQSAVSKLGHSFMLLCPGPLPLRHYLHHEAQINDIQLDPYFYQYVDINTEFSRGFPDTQRPSTLEEMCACILWTLYLCMCMDVLVHVYKHSCCIEHFTRKKKEQNRKE